MRCDKVKKHLQAKHPELGANDLAALTEFIDKSALIQQSTGLRLELDLAELSFRVLPGKTVLPEAPTFQTESTPQLEICCTCKKLLLPEHLVTHLRMHETNGTGSFRNLSLLPRYSKSARPLDGWIVQGGAPGLGKSA
jgi:hypothetical protein